jgi:hypothetical protein
MAHQASQLPASLDTTLLDWGRLVALWVSAFEILVHPSPNSGGTANKWEVYKLLEKMPWQMKENRKRSLKCRAMKKGIFDRRALPSWLYQKLNDARNDFLHGNPISKRRLLLPDAKRSLENFAAPLYRLALTSFLDLRWKGEIPSMGDVNAFASAIAERSTFDRYQREIEVAVAMSRGYKRKHSAAGRERRSRTP